VVVDVPVLRDGKVVYDLAASLPLTTFENAIARQRLAADWTIAVFDAKGRGFAGHGPQRAHDQCRQARRLGAARGHRRPRMELVDGPAAQLRLVWTGRGGAIVAPPTRRGFGSTLPVMGKQPLPPNAPDNPPIRDPEPDTDSRFYRYVEHNVGCRRMSYI
jgi:hypothetical protein